jgi:hypothetical protein
MIQSLTLILIMLTQTHLEKSAVDFKPERISKRATILVNASVDVAFPLFGPIREKDWAGGWNPEILYSTTNNVEEHMMFRTPGRFEGENFYTWIITQYKPEDHLIEYTVSTENRIWFIRVQCKSEGEKTSATISYTFTSLNEKGTHFNKVSLEKMYEKNLEDWQEEINYYLKTGTKLADKKPH